jgi:hypothetical protein
MGHSAITSVANQRIRCINDPISGAFNLTLLHSGDMLCFTRRTEEWGSPSFTSEGAFLAVFPGELLVVWLEIEASERWRVSKPSRTNQSARRRDHCHQTQ